MVNFFKNRKIKILFSFSTLICTYFFTSSLYALEIRSAIDNETVTAHVSALDITRIFVAGDRIQSVMGVKGAYTRSNDEEKGEIFIQPTNPYNSHAFTMLITTERGLHFTLLLIPTRTPSDTLMLVPKGVGSESAGHFEKDAPYVTVISHLIFAMRNHLIPPGYAVTELAGTHRYAFGRDFYLRRQTLYQGASLTGEIFAVMNMTSHVIPLDERLFYNHGTRAISLESISLPPHGCIHLYRIVSHV